MNRYTVYPGKHVFQLWGKVWEPPCLKRKPTRIQWRVRFDESIRYSLPGVDQQDWNKGGGGSFDLFTNHTDAAMWAFRYDPELDLIDLTAYCHVDGKRVIYKDILSSEIISKVMIGDDIDIVLVFDYFQKVYKFSFQVVGNPYKATCGIPFKHGKKLIRTIAAWFGGNNPAPQRIDLFLNREVG